MSQEQSGGVGGGNGANGANGEAGAGPSPAIQLLENGRYEEAEQAAEQAVSQAEARHGAKSAEYAAAQHDLGMVVGTLGDVERAVDAFRKASEVPAENGTQAYNDRLTYLMSLGAGLARLDEVDEAERVLRECCDARLAAYGKDHPGYAFGLEQLATVLSRKGDHDDAIKNAETAYAILYRAGHPGVTTALVHRAEVLKAAGSETPPFKGLESVPKSLVEQLALYAASRAEQIDPVVALAVLGEVRTLVVQRFGDKHGLTLHVTAEISNVSREAGDMDTCIESLRALVAGLDAMGEQGEAFGALQALAHAQTEAGQGNEAMATWDDALARAEKLGDKAARAGVQRQRGLLLAELGKRDEADATLRKALEDAEASGDKETLARTRVAHGIFLQHDGRGADAKAPLAQGAAALDAEDPDGMLAREHLDALTAGRDCGCAG